MEEFQILNTITAGGVTPDGASKPIYDVSQIQGIGVSSETGTLENGMVMFYDSSTGWVYHFAHTGYTGVTGYTGYTGYSGPTGTPISLNDLSNVTTTSTTGILLNIDATNNNVFFGQNAGVINTGTDNLFVGSHAGEANAIGVECTFIGSNAGAGGGTTRTIAIGYNVLPLANSVSDSIFIGHEAGSLITGTATDNTVIGASAGQNLASNDNVFLGYQAGQSTTTGGENTFAGSGSGLNNTTGASNVFVGGNSGASNTVGSRNTILGNEAGSTLTTGSDNTIIGYNADVDSADASNRIVIGDGATGTVDNALFMNHRINGSGTNAYWSGDELLQETSSRRFKEEIQDYFPENRVGEIKLRKFKYKSKSKPDLRTYIGMIAEELQEIYPEFVSLDSTGEPDGIFYDKMVVLLIELLKKQRRTISKIKSLHSKNG